MVCAQQTLCGIVSILFKYVIRGILNKQNMIVLLHLYLKSDGVAEAFAHMFLNFQIPKSKIDSA